MLLVQKFKICLVLFYQKLSQEVYNTKENRPHFVMANEIRAEVSLNLSVARASARDPKIYHTADSPQRLVDASRN